MTRIIGVRFRNLGKVYHFDAGDLEMNEGDHVIVETTRGVEYGRVMFAPRERTPQDGNYPLKEVIRVATPEDNQLAQMHAKREKEAYQYCLKKIREHKLGMKLIAAECTFNNRIMFYFTAEGRVDFRVLVKDLASVFKTRIELRQVGVRDETKYLGGIGICGRTLCCCTYLTDFVPVSIRMAKDQNLSLNQTKISGVCGRLMCCLKNEQETYEALHKTLPSVGEMVLLPDGMEGVVQSVNVLRQLVKVTFEVNDEKEMAEYPVEDLVLLGKKSPKQPKAQPPVKVEEKEKESKEKERQPKREKLFRSKMPIVTTGEKPFKGEKPEKEKPKSKKKKPAPPKAKEGGKEGGEKASPAKKRAEGEKKYPPKAKNHPEGGKPPKKGGDRPPKPAKGQGAENKKKGPMKESRGKNHHAREGHAEALQGE